MNIIDKSNKYLKKNNKMFLFLEILLINLLIKNGIEAASLQVNRGNSNLKTTSDFIRISLQLDPYKNNAQLECGMIRFDTKIQNDAFQNSLTASDCPNNFRKCKLIDQKNLNSI
jgi:hypothetical protein